MSWRFRGHRLFCDWYFVEKYYYHRIEDIKPIFDSKILTLIDFEYMKEFVREGSKVDFHHQYLKIRKTLWCLWTFPSVRITDQVRNLRGIFQILDKQTTSRNNFSRHFFLKYLTFPSRALTIIQVDQSWFYGNNHNFSHFNFIYSFYSRFHLEFSIFS